MNEIDRKLLKEIADLETVPPGAYNIRKNSKSDGRAVTANIDIATKTDRAGIDIRIKSGTVGESVHIPVIITETGLTEAVYNDFYIGDDCDVLIIAGCGILLPYIGPCLSASLTLLVTLAAGGSSGLQLAGIIAAYLIYNGIIEQFILYPAVIGESLGLTTLETIVVVLLGAVFAGLPGMLLAMPAASVLKYLIPKIHGYIRMRKVGEKP